MKNFYIASMSDLIKSQITAKLAKINFSDNSNLLARASDIICKGSRVGFAFDVTGLDMTEAETARKAVIEELKTIPSIAQVTIVLTSGNTAAQHSQDLGAAKGKILVDGVKKIILIASGKGGVGKSTCAALIAQKYAANGYKTALLDADIYGPSIPTIFGLSAKPIIENKRMLPLGKYGVKLNSIGFISDPASAISWRGPMLGKALYQLLSLTNWGDIEYLFVDTPPGTGDIHLNLLQNYTISGVIMITTPQEVSVVNVKKAINLYQKFNIPIFGIVENMSYYLDANTGDKIDIFAGQGGKKIADQYNIPVIATLPILPKLSAACDAATSLRDFFDFLPFITLV